MVHDPVGQGHDKYNSFLSSPSFNSEQTQVVPKCYAVQLDLRTVADKLFITIKECLQRFISIFITCAAKLFSNVKLELTCSNNGVAMW